MQYQIPLMNVYTTDKIEVSAFASDSTIRNMMEDTERIFANQFGKKVQNSSNPADQ